MIEEKTISINDLKYHYDNRHGFVMSLGAASSNSALERMCTHLITQKITDTMPEFVVTSDYRSMIVVYPEGTSFEAPTFYQKAVQLGQATGAWNIELLQVYLKQQP